MLKSGKNFDIFYNTVISKKQIFYHSNKTISETSDSKFNTNTSFIFEKKYLFLFTLNGNLIFSFPEIEKNNEYKDIINKIITKINKIGNKPQRNGNTITENIYFNIFIIGNKDKFVIVRIGDINIISLGIFSKETKTSIIKLYLLNNLIMFLNYLDIESSTIPNTIKNNNNLQINIYKQFFLSSFCDFFILLTRQLFQRHKYKLKNIFYKNYSLIELNSNKIIFSFESLYNNLNNNGDKYQLKISNKEHIWTEVLYHCHILKNNYLKQYSINFNEENYDNFFAIFELKSTFPRRIFIIKFLPILNGVCLIHEFVQTKLSSNEGNEINHYKEYESIYGYFNEINTLSQKTCNSTHSKLFLFKNEPNFLRRINSFFVGSLSLKIKHKDLFFSGKNNNIFICEDVLGIINNYLIKENLSDNYNNIIREIEKKLYDEYLQEIKQQEQENNDVDLDICNKNQKIILFNNDDYFTEENLYQKIDLNIPKKYMLETLFNKRKQNNPYLIKEKEISLLSKKFLGSKKDCTKLSEILNENISENIGSYYHSTKRSFKENNSYKTSNIFDSTNNILNLDNSENIFNANISVIKNNKAEIEIENLNEREDLNSKEEFFEGENINNLK